MDGLASLGETTAAVSFDHVVKTFKQVLRPGFKTFTSIKLEGLNNYDAWLYDLKKWLAFEDDFISKKLSYDAIDPLVKEYYSKLKEDELRELITQINYYLCAHIKKCVDTSKVATNFNNFHELWKEIKRVGETDIIGRQIAELKSNYKAFRSYEDHKRHCNIYPETNDWKIHWMAFMFNPFKVSENSLRKLFISFNYTTIDNDFKNAVKLEEVPGLMSDRIIEELRAHCERELDLKHDERRKSNGQNRKKHYKHGKKANPKNDKFSNGKIPRSPGKPAKTSSMFAECSLYWIPGADVQTVEDLRYLQEYEDEIIDVEGSEGHITETFAKGTIKILPHC